MDMRQSMRWIVGIMAGLVAASGALGSTDNFVTLTFIGDGPTGTGYVTGVGPEVYIGRSNFSISTTDGSYGGLGADIVAQSYGNLPHYSTTGWCIDIHQWIYGNTSYVFYVMDLALAPTIPSGRADDLQRLFYQHEADVADGDTAAAFAASVWEIVNETDTTIPYNIGTGDFRVTPSGGTWDTIANGWLSGLGSGTVDAYALVSTTTQDFAWVLPVTGTGGPTVVPEPLTMASAFLAISGLGLYIRKRTRTMSA